MLCNSYSKRFCDFYIFPIVGISAINFQSKKAGNPPFFQSVFFFPKEVENLFDFDFHELHNMTNVFVHNLGFYRARFSIRDFLKERLVHSSASAKTIPAFESQTVATNIPWTAGQRRTLKRAKQFARMCYPLLKLLLIKKYIILTPCTSTQRKRTKTRKRTMKQLPNSFIKLLNYRHPIVRFLQKTRAWCRSKSL